MKKTKLISVIGSFSEKELKAFEKFVSSAYHSGSRNLLPLLKALKKYYPDFNSPKLTKENLYKKIHPGKDYDDDYIRKQMSFLYKLAEDFMVSLAIEENNNERSILLMNQFQKRELYNLFENESHKINNDIRPDKYRLQDYYTERLRYEASMFNHYYESENNFKKAFPYIKAQLEEASPLFLYVLINSIKSRDVIKKNMDTGYENKLADILEETFDIESFLKKYELKGDGELLLIDYYIWKAVISGKRDLYQKAKETLLKHINSLSRSMRYRYFMDLNSINISFSKDRRNDSIRPAIIKENFDLIKLQVKYNALTDGSNKLMANNQYAMILNTSLSLKEFGWAEEFIENYSDKVGPSHRKNMRHLGYGTLYFAKGEFEKSLEELINVKLTDPFLKLTVRDLNLSLFYELKLFEEARYLITTSNKYYAATKELTPKVKESGVNFLKYYRQLLFLTEKEDKIQTEIILSKLKSEKNMEGKLWLIKKYEALLV